MNDTLDNLTNKFLVHRGWVLESVNKKWSNKEKDLEGYSTAQAIEYEIYKKIK